MITIFSNRGNIIFPLSAKASNVTNSDNPGLENDSLVEECHSLKKLARIQKEITFLQQSHDYLAAIQRQLEASNWRLK
ncbi:hypothetical protein ACI01nite_26040 [Acetobacter cibinongensis]|uniref:Uncharacterized protein n=1 Tax=Acetobacter cibinongensis TaxID=146475 RepID=A0A0D6N652_9PROT|nr:hypothetical protein [Acetobacter cibinongensis]GAN61434.1 hypothetical protein Abci_024_003 [Acetobacter cibinongensis]GBQ14362.1 hypothetical protein AA0482_0885 [Acetobacter cibinongensis NRIC 0482]GEL60002.1 hypothetical protein ACI01nite_26040 [Acetobacter cibinongensis]